MGLQDKLDDIKKQFESKAPPEVLALMHRSTEDLANSGIMDKVIKVNDLSPQFTLPDQNKMLISSSDLVKNGPVVISFYRGVW